MREPAEPAYHERRVPPALMGGRVEFLGELGSNVRDALRAGRLAALMARASSERFGSLAVESVPTGTPVIARRAGVV